MFVTRGEYRKLMTELALLKRRVAILEREHVQKPKKTVSELTQNKDGEKYTSAVMLDEWLNGEEKANG